MEQIAFYLENFSLSPDVAVFSLIKISQFYSIFFVTKRRPN